MSVPRLQQVDDAQLEGSRVPRARVPRMPGDDAPSRLPGGAVTFMFTDVEGSTRLLQALGEATFREALDRHHVLVRKELDRHGGVEVRTIGDAFFAAFTDPGAALLACAGIQRAFAAEAWPGSTRFAVRIGVHCGRVEPHHDDYVGLAVHQAARIAATGHGGQVVVSAAVREATDPERNGLQLVNLGEHLLKDFDVPIQLHQLAAPDLARDFPALSTPRRRDHHLRARTTTMIGQILRRWATYFHASGSRTLDPASQTA